MDLYTIWGGASEVTWGGVTMIVTSATAYSASLLVRALLKYFVAAAV